MNGQLNAIDVWTLIAAGCNAREIAAFAGVAMSVAYAMVANATRHYAHAA